MSNDPAQNMNLTGGLPVGGRVEIFPSMPLPDFNSVGGPAYLAHSRGGGDASDLMGILCNTGLPARLDVVNSMRTIDHPSVLRYVDNGVVLWPQNNSRYCVLAYQRPLAPRLKNSLDETHQPLGEDAL